MEKIGLILIIALLFHSSLMAQEMPSLIPYPDNGKYGYCDSSKTIRIQPQWDEAGLFHNEKALVRFKNYLGEGSATCIVDITGHYIVPPEYHWDGNPFAMRLNAHNARNQYGIIDTTGAILIPFLYEKDSYNNYFQVSGNKKLYYMIARKKGKLGIIDSQNKTLLPFIYDRLWEMYAHSGTFFIGWKAKDNNWVIVNLQNNIILKNPNPELSDNVAVTHGFGQEGFLVNEDSLSWSFADTNGYYLLRNKNGNHSFIGTYLYDHSHKKPKLYDQQGNLVLEGAKGDAFQAKNDTLIWYKKLHKKKKHKYFVYSRVYRNYQLKALLPMDSVEHIKKWESRMIVPGYGRDHIILDVPTKMNGYNEFDKDGKIYYVLFGLSSNRYTVFRIEDSPVKQTKWFAVVDTNQHFIITPQDSLLISRYSTADNHFQAYNYNSRQYCLLDSALTLLYCTPYRIKEVRLSDGKYYALVDTNQQRSQRWLKQAASVGRSPEWNMPYGDAGLLLSGPDGNLSEATKALHSITFIPSFAKKNSWIIKTKDENGKTGFTSLNGEPLLTQISFKYNNIYRITGNVFFVNQAPAGDSGILIDSSNHRLHPENISVSPISYSTTINRFSYTRPGDQKKYEFYIGHNGKIFVGVW